MSLKLSQKIEVEALAQMSKIPDATQALIYKWEKPYRLPATLAIMSEEALLYRFRSRVTIGQVERYVLTYTPEKKSHYSKEGTYLTPDQSSLFVRVKNCESLHKRAAYLMGPYILYVDARPAEFTHLKPCYITADQPSFEPNLQPSQAFTAELSCHIIRDQYVWVVDVVSQMLFSSKTSVEFEIGVARSVEAFASKKYVPSPFLKVQRLNTKALWSLPPPMPEKPVHLVILTHGLHSNVGADMLYLKEQIEKSSKDNVIVRGYHDNVCKTERGVKYLGMKVAEYVVNEAYDPKVNRISFVAHLLGGLVQTFAVAYIAHNFPWFFRKVRPVNFVAIASPLLGISKIDSPSYVQAALSLGAVGRTGQELSLTPTELDGTKALLELLPSGVSLTVLRRFNRRTVYANAVNDGIVPLRTSALLFLDYEGLKDVARLLNSGESPSKDSQNANSQASSFQPAPSVLQKPQKKVYNIPDFMSTLSFVYSGNPLISITNESAQAKPEETRLGERDVSEVLRQNQSKSPSSLPSQSKETSTHIGEIPEFPVSPQQTNLQSFLTPLQNAFASWVAPQGTEESPSDTNENPLPKASVIESAKSILLPTLPPKEYILDPSARQDPVIHDKFYDDEDIKRFKENKRVGDRTHETPSPDSLLIGNQSSDTKQDFALNPFADNFSSFFASKSKKEVVEEQIAMKWHDGMRWRKVLVNVKPDAHNNVIVRRRFANAYGWSVVDHIVKEHFGLDPELEDEVERTLEAEEGDLTDRMADGPKQSYSSEDDAKSGALEIPKQTYAGVSPRMDSSSPGIENRSFYELNSLLVKDTLVKENDSNGYTPILKPSVLNETSSEGKESYEPELRDTNDGDWINIKNYDEDSLFTMGPTGFLSNVNDKISKIL